MRAPPWVCPSGTGGGLRLFGGAGGGLRALWVEVDVVGGRPDDGGRWGKCLSWRFFSVCCKSEPSSIEPSLSLRLGAFVVAEATTPRLVALSVLGLLIPSEPDRDGGGLIDCDCIFSMLRLVLVCFGFAGGGMAPLSCLSEPVGLAA